MITRTFIVELYREIYNSTNELEVNDVYLEANVGKVYDNATWPERSQMFANLAATYSELASEGTIIERIYN